MKNGQIPVLYLFENVFFPETVIPMVLSDEASKALVSESFQNDSEIALYSTHPKSKGVATIGRILMIEKRDDGKLTAVIQGVDRISLTQLVQHIPYPVYTFSTYQDNKESHIFKDGSIERLFHIFEDWINRHLKNISEREVFLREINTPKKLVFNISLFMIQDIELKIMFLESTSMVDRIHILDLLLAGEKPEREDKDMAEAIKNFERLEVNYFKNVAN